MRIILLSLLFLIFLQPVSAQDVRISDTKCTDLILNMHKAHETISNVLNLTDDQKKCKKTIDKKFENEFLEICDVEKEIKNIDEYDKEFRQILTREQRSKLKDIRRMEKSALKACQKNKVFYKPDENLIPFGLK